MPRPTPDQVQRVMAAIRTAADADYFFDSLTSPDWIRPLREAGMFQEAPKAIRDGDLVQLPGWSASRYLVRMAPLAPADVAATIAAIPPTENGRVVLDLVEAVIAMPDEFAVQLADEACGWGGSSLLLGLPSRLGELIDRLARAGASRQALELLGELIKLDPPESDADAVGFRWGIRSRMRPWDYRRLLDSCLPALLDTDGEGTFDLLIATLLPVLADPSNHGPDHLSWSWRPAIEDHAQNSGSEQVGALLTATRRAAEHVAGRGDDALTATVQRLTETSTTVGDRLVLHLVRLFASEGSEILASTLVDQARIGQIDTHHEYWMLLRDRYEDLNPADQSTLLSLIFNGPDFDEDTSEEDKARFREGWIRRYLAALDGQLGGTEHEQLDAFAPNLDSESHPEFLAYGSSGSFGASSPLDTNDLSTTSIDEILTLLATWRPNGEWRGPSVEGLANTLTAVVEADPARFDVEAPRFAELDPTYVRGFISAFTKTVDTGTPVVWEPLLELAHAVVHRPRARGTVERRSPPGADRDLGWVRNEIAHLLKAGLKAGEAQLQIPLRQRVWSLLAILAEDPEPDAEYEARYGGSNMDPTTLSLNTVRGQALGAVMDYMLWIRRDHELRGNQKALDSGFDAMPEVRDLLERHLNPAVDPSAAIRAVYGRMMPWLVLVDKPWVRTHLPRLFPEAEPLAHLRNAAWDAYVVYSRVYDQTFDVLEDEYSRAIDRLGSETRAAALHDDPGHQLGEHLLIQYWRGHLDLSEDGFIRRFFESADDDARAAALNLVGRSLDDAFGNGKEAPPSDLIERLRALWKWRIETVTADGTADHARRELAQFGWWYGSGAFDPEWALPQLATATRLGGSPEGEHLALKQLVADVEAEPVLAVDALAEMIRRDSERWLALGYRQEVGEVLRAAIKRGGATASERAIAIVHELGVQGFRDYRDVLPR